MMSPAEMTEWLLALAAQHPAIAFWVLTVLVVGLSIDVIGGAIVWFVRWHR